MLPDNAQLDTPQTKEWPVIPNDIYQCEITDVEYKTEPNKWKEKDTDPDTKNVMNFVFTIIEPGEFYGRKLFKKMAAIKPYPPSGSSKGSTIYKLAVAMEGHAITKDEADGFGPRNINDYVHQQVRIHTVPSEPKADGKVWSNIEGFLSVKQQLPPFDPNKVQENSQPAVETPPQANSATPGFDKFIASKDTILGAKPVAEAQNDGIEVAPDIAEEAARMAADIDVSDIPF
jgi:hypothetical protein